jgi:large repetitive protein
LVQDFYLPMPETQIYQANSAIISGTDSNMLTTISIMVTTPGTRIYYDQWEDGYEPSLASPAQSTTQIWGDGNDAHGIPPGFAHNPLGLPAGTVIILTNAVTYPRNPSTISWDGGDHIAATAPLMVTRAAWPVKTGPVFAGAVSVLPTSSYGTNFLCPIGQDITNNLMKYVGLFVMAAQNNTVVTIATNGNGTGLINLVLNQGQSYLVNGGIKKGASVTSSQPVQADLIIGHVGTSYASDWFTLYPVSLWGNTYNTAVGSAANGQPAYVYLFNPNTNALTIACATKTGNSSVTIPGTNGVYQFQMPVASGGSFTSTNGQNFFAVCTVAALPSNDTAWNWGFTLVPGGALTTEADIAWGPGSSDGTVNGSPAWVTPLANTTIYVSYLTGAHKLTDPNGNAYDTNFNVTALQSLKVYDPSKNQTGMRLYTVDGTLLTGAWGEDPDVAGSGNPYIDAGTTAVPLAMPVLRKSALILTNAANGGLGAGATVQYSVTLANLGVVPLQNATIVDTPAATVTYLANSTTLNGTVIPDATNNTFPLVAPGYLFPVVLSGATNTFTYKFKVNSVPNGTLSNSVTLAGTSIRAICVLTAPPTAGASCSILFTTTNGTASPTYLPGALVYLTMTNQVAASPTNQLNKLNVTVYDTSTGDYETITLTETGLGTGIFRNITGLPTSLTGGLSPLDGTLYVASGDTLSVAYTDPTFGDSCSANAVIQAAVPQKQLYLSLNGSTNGTQALNRVDPVAYNHGPAASSIDIGPSVVTSATTNTYAVGVASSTFNLTAGTNSSLTISNVITSGTNRLMIVGVSFSNPSRTTSGGGISNVLYGATSLTRLTNSFVSSTYVGSEIWYLTNPPTGVTNVVVKMTNSTMEMVAGVVTMTNVDLIPISV